jgi:hypothetical protein
LTSKRITKRITRGMSRNAEENETSALIRGLQDAFRIRNDARMPSFCGGNQDPMEWLEEFNRSAGINQYTNEYKLRVVAGYLQGTAGHWFKETQAGRNPITRWNDRDHVSFEPSFLATFKTTTLINQWRFELQMKVQKLNETVEQYANDVKRLIKRINGENRWSEDEKVWQFLKGLRKDVAYQARPLILSQENPSLEAAIRTAKQFEEHAQTYPEATIGYGVATYANTQGFTPTYSQDNNREDAIGRIVQEALAPIVKTLQKITERDDRIMNMPYRRTNYENPRTANMSYRRPNYDNSNGGQNTRNHNNTSGDPFRCFVCGQPGHMARVCPTKQGYARNPVVPPTQEPARAVQPQANAATNQPASQMPRSGANSSTFVTQQEEAERPTVTVWEGMQSLNY